MTEKFNFINTCNSIAEVFEAMDSIVMVDCAKVMECADSTILAIVEADNSVNVNVLRSVHAGASCNNFETMTEALNQVERVTGNDIKSLYENRINEEMKNQDPEGYNKIQEELAAAKDAQMSERRKKISILAEQFKNDPVKIALLNNVAKELAILEGVE
jgi:pyruvate/oxaloacetate carboxyltransferase